MCPSLRRWFIIFCSEMLRVFDVDVCSRHCWCPAHILWHPLLPHHVSDSKGVSCFVRQPCCFAQSVKLLPISNQGLEQWIEQTPDPGALNSSEFCIQRSWHDFIPRLSWSPPQALLQVSCLGGEEWRPHRLLIF